MHNLLGKMRLLQTTFFLALDDEVLFNVQTIDIGAKDLWDSLHRVMDKSLVNKIFLRRQLYNLKDEASIHEHLIEFNSLVNKLLGTCVKIYK